MFLIAVCGTTVGHLCFMVEEIIPAILVCITSIWPVFLQNSCKSKNDAGSEVIMLIISPEFLVAKNFLVLRTGKGQLSPVKSNSLI